MTYTCSVWRTPDVGLEAAQAAKHELVCRKFGLRPGMRVENLERHWDEAVAEVDEARARIWRQYMAGSALSFERGHSGLYQVVAVKPEGGRSGLPLRPVFE